MFFNEQDLSNFSVSIFPKNPVLPVTKTVLSLNDSAMLVSMLFSCVVAQDFYDGSLVNSNLNWNENYSIETKVLEIL